MSIVAKRPTQRIEFVTDLDMKAEHEAAVAHLAAVQKQASYDARETGSEAVTEAAAAVQELERHMREHTVVFTLEAWPRKRWVEHEETHPPREGREDDKNLGIDVASLDEVLAGSIKSVTNLDGEPVEFNGPTEWAQLAENMTSGQWQEFALAVLRLNRGVTAAPFSPLASVVTRRSAETSKQQSA